MSIPRLPLELIHSVAELADAPSLAALSRTCHTLQSAAERLLYRHLSLSSATNSCRAVLSVAARPALARHVRTFALTIEDKKPMLRAYYKALTRALGAMSLLSELDLKIDANASWVLDDLPPSFALLRSFTCSFPFDASLSRFLSRTPSLSFLELAPDAPSTPPDAVPLSAVPQLTHFSGSLVAAQALAPGHPLASVHLLDGDCTLGILATIARSSITVFSASTSSPLVPFLRALALHAPGLVYLRLTAPLSIAHDAALPDIGFYEQVANALDALPHLVDFELAGMHWPSHTEQPSARRVWQSAPSTPRPSTPVLEAIQDPVDSADNDLYADLEILY